MVYDLVILALPVIQSGAIFGTRITKFLPNILLSVVLFTVVYSKYRQNRNGEIAAEQKRLR